MPEGQTINQHYYLDVLRRLREAVHAVLGPCQFSVVVVVSDEKPQMSPYISITAMSSIRVCKAAALGPC
ncbi:hypothetical protein LAZ67_1006710 [Cordylochernes scorpioides]|uniref:Uncharacterized protein n=1 Tax=Cordylochernes scorpioides TaxID=51811 RepID=A0ABY6K3L9_9ARAC|nr:hypothetical protein LAZ67_1006710 [Cordylochernes scorpioides]